MDIGAVKTSKMSPADRAKEKQRRRDLDLCYWCGSNEHKIPNCPTAPTEVKNRSRLRIVAASNTPTATSENSSPKA